MLSALFFFGSVALIPLLPTGFIPPDDNSQTQVYLELPPGSTLEQTKATAEQARLMIAKVEHVKSVYTTIGGGSAGTDPFAPSGAAEARKATLTILLAERGDRPRKQGIENKIRTALEPLPGVRSKVGLGGSGEKYILVLTGEDPQALQHRGAGGGKGPAHHPRPGQRRVHRQPDPARDRGAARLRASAADLGVTSAAIGRDAAHRHRRRLRHRPAQAEPVAAAGADRGQAARRTRART